MLNTSHVIEYRGFVINTALQAEDNGQWICSVTIFDRLGKVMGMGGPSFIRTNPSSTLAEEVAIEEAKELVDAEIVTDRKYQA
jgi:hypothetical protein